MAGSWLYGSARYLSSAITEPSRVPITTPVSTSASSGSWPRRRDADPVDQPDRREPAGEREQLDEDHPQRKKDPEHRAERGAGRDAEDVGRHQRVAEHPLVGGARCGKRGTHDQRRQHARPAHLPNHRLDVGVDRLAEKQRNNLGQRDRIAAHGERERRQRERARRGEHVAQTRGRSPRQHARLAEQRVELRRRSVPGDRTGGGTRPPWRAGRCRSVSG